MDTREKSRLFEQAARNERQSSPQIVQPTSAKRYEVTYKAYARADAGTGDTLDCDLGEVGSGSIISVKFNIIPPGYDLQDCLPQITNGQLIMVRRFKDSYWAAGNWMPACISECGCVSET